MIGWSLGQQTYTTNRYRDHYMTPTQIMRYFRGNSRKKIPHKFALFDFPPKWIPWSLRYQWHLKNGSVNIDDLAVEEGQLHFFGGKSRRSILWTKDLWVNASKNWRTVTHQWCSKNLCRAVMDHPLKNTLLDWSPMRNDYKKEDLLQIKKSAPLTSQSYDSKIIGRIPMTRNDDSHNCDKSDPQLLLPNFWCHISSILKTNHLIFEMFRETPWFCVVFHWFPSILVPARYLPAPPPRATSPVLQRALHERILRPQWHRKLHPNLDWKQQLLFWLVGLKPNIRKFCYVYIYIYIYVKIYICVRV